MMQPKFRPPAGLMGRAGLAGLYVALVVLPLGPPVWDLLGQGSTGGWGLAIPWGRRFWLLLNSLALAGAVSLGGLGIGFLAAMRLWRYQTGWASRMRWFLLALALMPPYLQALAWMSLAASLTAWWPALGNFLVLPSSLACWWVQTLAMLPLALGLCLAGLESLDLSLVEAGRVLEGDLGTLRRIALPLAAPYLWSGGALLMLLNLLDYSVPSLFGINVYSLEIFAEYSASHSAARALLLALPLLVLTTTIILASQELVRETLRPRISQSRQRWAVPPAWPRWFSRLQGAALGVVVVSLLVPVITLGGWVASPVSLLSTWTKAAREIWYTFGFALAAAVVSLPVALGVSQRLLTPGTGRPGWWLLTLLPLAVPPPLVGLGLIGLSGLFPWNILSGTGAMPVLATVARFLPLGVLVLLAQGRQVDRRLFEAAALLESSHWQIWRRIKLPLLGPGCLAGGALIFALSAGELGAVLLVAPPGRSTLTITMYNYLHYGAPGVVGGLGLLMALASLVAGLLVVAVLTRPR